MTHIGTSLIQSTQSKKLSKMEEDLPFITSTADGFEDEEYV